MINSICHTDIESFSEVNLGKCGVYKYAEHENTEILCVCFAFDDEPPSIWIPHDIPYELETLITRYQMERGGDVYIGLTPPECLVDHAASGGQFRAHNAQFERIMLKGGPGRKINFPKTKRSQWVCTAAKAAVHSLPRALGKLAKALKTEHQKDEDGKAQMMQVSKPRKPSKAIPETRWTPHNTPERFFKLYRYCIDDVDAERDCDHAIKDLGPQELQIYLLDQIINDRGWKVDTAGVEDVQFLIAEYKKKLVERCLEITGLKPTQTEKFAVWVREQGIKLENLQAQTIKDALKRKDLPKNVRWALRIRSLHEMKAPAKYTAMQRAMCRDNALRGMFLFFGASTGRWSSKYVQLQNLFRPVIKDADTAIELFRSRDIDILKILYDKNPMQIFSSCVRGMLVPREGHDLLFCDFSSIEARIVAWLANQIDMLEIFATHGLAYEYTGAKMFGMPLDLESLKAMKISHEMKRFLGKIAVLALGYEGGGNAFVKMAKQYGTEIDFEQGEQIKHDWRRANPKVADYDTGIWANLNNCAIAAVQNPGVTYKTNKLMFRVVGSYLYMRLPSGRKLAYYKPFVKGDELRFWGVDTYIRQWCICSTYGGKLLQNAAEGIARDLMTTAMIKLYKTKRYPMLGTVHDEIIMEPREGDGSVDEVKNIMCDSPQWAEGLPVGAAGELTKRYGK